jgi:hypothetical protein
MNTRRGQSRSGLTAVELLILLIGVVVVFACLKNFPKSSVPAQNQAAPAVEVSGAAHAVKETGSIASVVMHVARAADTDEPAVAAPAVEQPVADPPAAVAPAVEPAGDDGWGDILDDIFDGL